MAITLFITFVVFLLIGVPISIALGLSSMVAVLVQGQMPVMVVVQKIFGGVSSFTLMAIPFFILAGNIMSEGGVSKRLVDLADAFLGRVTGGLALVATVASTFFGAISGSAPATTAAIGAVMVKPMQEKGYSKDFAAATVAASGTIGLLIPPSITMVLYGVTAGVSIGKLFLGGIIPGLLMCVALMGVEYYISKKNGYHGDSPVSVKAILEAFKKSILALIMPLIILGGIYGGIFTPTEAAVVAVVYGLLVGLFAYKQLNFKNIPKIVLDSAKGTAVIMYLVATAHIFSYILSSEQIPQKLAEAMLNISKEPTIVLFLIIICVLVAGTFLDNAVAMVLLTPIFYPIIMQIGIDPIFFGVIMVFALAIGQITPPVGLCLFIACNIADISIEKLTKAIIPHLVALIILLIILALFPDIILLIPNSVTM
ncbi:TRAP transporter large permease [Clostridium sp.]|uniref:TRAP transporter large permease n=1 Tax=Clostridium sp. TaxID=1506 RepID=UPI001A5AD131|nr:TRAP transporter large permease [Clostridium sp.]MBK5241485.1 TRAP transporter large permease [Clostridium sp.]